MVRVDPVRLGRGQGRDVDQRALQRGQRQLPEPEVPLPAEAVLRGRLLDGDQVLDADAEATLARAPVPAAQIKIRNTANGAERKVATAAEGL